jgi:hypothetical protein
MFNLFKPKSQIDKLNSQYDKLIKEWHRLSTINRSESDKKYAEAQEILNQIELLKKAK